MKLLLITFAVVCFACAAMAEEEQYTSKYDNIDYKEILKSDRLFNNYYKCLTDEGNCTPDGRELKKILPDALQTACSKCNDKQKAAAEEVARFVIDNKPMEWKVLQAKYDPEGVFYAKYKDEAAKRGIIV
ncbi:ejaculatory bulb-specific protein 3-like [Musca autumnalis]|uniref:ejaculatory bulb-specific protein 3-like n=1 Tax=Musca autumnalis TaxID=221902 RepID=UPI003CFA0B43